MQTVRGRQLDGPHGSAPTRRLHDFGLPNIARVGLVVAKTFGGFAATSQPGADAIAILRAIGRIGSRTAAAAR
jgi:hypothetical protein